jgi:hypothetical protein
MSLRVGWWNCGSGMEACLSLARDLFPSTMEQRFTTHDRDAQLQPTPHLQTLVRDCTPPCASAQGHTNTMFLLTMTNHVVVEPRPFTASSSGVVYCSSYYWLRKAGTRCASKGAEQASSGKADLFGSAPTQLGLGDWSYMSELYLVSWPLPALPTFRN